MSIPKEGSYVRITIESLCDGVDTSIREYDIISITDGGEYIVGNGGVVSIEVISRPFVFPTKLWAQVADAGGNLFTRISPPGEALKWDLCEWSDLGGNLYSSEYLLNRLGLQVISSGVDE